MWDTNCTWTSSPVLFDDLHSKTINCCGIVRPDRKVMPKSLDRKQNKQGGIKNRVEGT
jgi:hypothetical protein